MNMKKLLLLFLCIASLSGICKTTDPPDGGDEIVLIGRLDVNQGPNDIEAYVYQNAVYIYFHRSFGDVSITLYNSTGATLYSDVVNTAIQQMVIIPISGFADTNYTLVLENFNGYAEGEFGNNLN